MSWKRANGTGAVVGAIVGFCVAIAGWLGTTAALNDGVITVETTFQDYPMLTGNLLSIGVGGIVTVVWSLIQPEDFDWDITRAINQSIAKSSSTIDAGTPEEVDESAEKKEKDIFTVQEASPSGTNTPREEALPSIVDEAQRPDDDLDMALLKKSFRFAAVAALSLTFILIIAIPLPLFFSSHGESASLDCAEISVPCGRLYCVCDRVNHLAICWWIYGGGIPNVGGS